MPAPPLSHGLPGGETAQPARPPGGRDGTHGTARPGGGTIAGPTCQERGPRAPLPLQEEPGSREEEGAKLPPPPPLGAAPSFTFKNGGRREASLPRPWHRNGSLGTRRGWEASHLHLSSPPGSSPGCQPGTAQPGGSTK